MAVPIGVAAAAAAIAKTASQVLSRALGGKFGFPRGDFKKFSRTLFPTLLAQAREVNRPVHAFWFGDVVEVTPQANTDKPIVRARVGTLSAANQFWNNLERTEHFDVFRSNDPVDFNDLNDVFAKSTFEERGRGRISLPGLPGAAKITETLRRNALPISIAISVVVFALALRAAKRGGV